jgi:hypothetical protein
MREEPLINIMVLMELVFDLIISFDYYNHHL